MKRWIMAWLRSWRDQRFVVEAPLSVAEARRRFAAGLASRRAIAEYAYEHGFGGSSVIDGRLSGDYLTLRVSQTGTRNAWQLNLNGHLEATDTGCRFVGRIGWHPFTRVISIVWIAIFTVAIILNLASAVAHLVTGHAWADTNPATAVTVSIGGLFFFAGLVAVGTWMSRDEAPRLRDWITNHLQPEV